MHDQIKALKTPYEEDRDHEGAVLAHVVAIHPQQIRLSELVRELSGDSGDGVDRVRIEDAVRGLCGAGLLYRCEAMLVPTRAAMRAYEVLVGEA